MPTEAPPTPQVFPEIRENPRSEEHLRELGQSIAAWSKNHNFNPRLVYAVLRGERKCVRGQSFEIARELGMK
jgi:gp16 family phage-associated protein